MPQTRKNKKKTHNNVGKQEDMRTKYRDQLS